MMEKKECGECLGPGVVRSYTGDCDVETCRNCRGKGVVPVYTRDDYLADKHDRLDDYNVDKMDRR